MGQQRVRTGTKISYTGQLDRGSDYATYVPAVVESLDYKWMSDETGHGWSDPPFGAWDRGGDMTSRSFVAELTPCEVSIPRGSGLYQNRFAKGSLVPYAATWDGSSPSQQQARWMPPSVTSNAALFAAGGTAISRCAPTNPHASVGTALGELRRDGLPAVTGIATMKNGLKPSTVGGEYLNVEFGIKPLLSDIRKTVAAMSRSRAILAQYVRDSNRVVRRRYQFPPSVSSSGPVDLGLKTPYPTLDTYYWADWSQGKTTRTQVTTVNRWFSGAFTYRSAVPKSVLSQCDTYIRQLNHLLGLAPTLSTFWNLTPWTWALDWFVNMGDVVNNLSMMASDGLVMRYGYIMEETSVVNTYQYAGGVLKNGFPVTCSAKTVFRQKLRRAASPFGFGLTYDGFSSRQQAIIAALGMTQGGRYIAK